MTALTRAVQERKASKAVQKAIDVAQSVLDLELRHRTPAEIDVERFHLWTQQLRVHAAAKDLAGVTGAVAVLEWIRDRVAHMLSLQAAGRSIRASAPSESRAIRRTSAPRQTTRPASGRAYGPTPPNSSGHVPVPGTGTEV
jgi:hypothetical protein